MAPGPSSAQAEFAKDKSSPASLRWAEGVPGCTFSRDEDGKWTGLRFEAGQVRAAPTGDGTDRDHEEQSDDRDLGRPFRIAKGPDESLGDALHAGRYGQYVKHGKINATLPKDIEPDSLTVEQAVALIEARAQAKGIKRGGKAKAKANPANDDAPASEAKSPKIKAAASATAKPPAKAKTPAKAKGKAKTKAKAKSKPKGRTEPVASDTDSE